MVFRKRKTFRKRRSLKKSSKKRRTMRKRIMKGGVIKYAEFSGLPQTGEDVKTILGDLDKNSFDEEAIDFTRVGSYPIFFYKDAIWLTSGTYPGSNSKFFIINKNGDNEIIDTKDPEFQEKAILLKRRWS
jgi:hypothetical protein